MKNNLYDYGIYFNNHHSTEFGLDVLDDKVITFPEKRKILQTIPHSNIVFDYSSVYGSQAYSERTFTVTFNLIDRINRDKESLYVIWTKVLNWLMEPTTKTPLFDDVMKQYYYLAEVQKKPDFDEFLKRGELKVEFQCYPFRISLLEEGNDKWDIFNFELDIAQVIEYKLTWIEKEITLFNVGISSIPVVIAASKNMILTIDGKNHSLVAGDNAIAGFFLKPGLNQFKMYGEGTISFKFSKEVI